MQEVEAIDEKTGKMKKKLEKMKSRSGDTVKLNDLLNEAKARAMTQFKARLERQAEHQNAGEEGLVAQRVQVDPAKLEEAAEILGLSSIKYFDLKQNRINDYAFDFDRMLDPEGDTGVYLIYQYVRIGSIIEKSQYGTPEAIAQITKDVPFVISDPKERELALTVLRLPEQLDLAIADLQVNRICELVYDIAVKIGQYVAAVRVKDSPEEASRILFLISVRKVMATCFDLLGMKTLNKI